MPSQLPTGYTGQGSPASFQDRLSQQNQQNAYYNQPSAYNVAAFNTPTAQQIGMQQQQLAALMQGQYQLSPQVSPYFTQGQPGTSIGGELNTFIGTANAWAQDSELWFQMAGQQQQTIGAIAPFVQAASYWRQDSERWYQTASQQQETISAIAPFVQAANAWAEDSERWYQMANNAYATAQEMYRLMSDPQFLIAQAFDVWEREIAAEDGQAMELISANYLQLANKFDQLFLQKYGMLPTAQQQQGMPVPPVPGAPGQNMSAVQQQIERMKNPHPDLAKQMQLEHNGRRMAMGAI